MNRGPIHLLLGVFEFKNLTGNSLIWSDMEKTSVMVNKV